MKQDYILQVLELKLNETLKMLEEINEKQEKLNYENSFSTIPEWVNLETAYKIKGGGALNSYKKNSFLQPCCGLNFKYVCGRKSWNKKDVIEWLEITDQNLKEYAEKYGVTLPKTYEKRSN